MSLYNQTIDSDRLDHDGLNDPIAEEIVDPGTKLLNFRHPELVVQDPWRAGCGVVAIPKHGQPATGGMHRGGIHQWEQEITHKALKCVGKYSSRFTGLYIGSNSLREHTLT